ncbi:MAG: hypothetical protein ACFB8W_25135 [Elainellaceae cyanobacterium]
MEQSGRADAWRSPPLVNKYEVSWRSPPLVNKYEVSWRSPLLLSRLWV